jgi:TPR repeat protein
MDEVMRRTEILKKIAELEAQMKKGDRAAEAEWAHMYADLAPDLMSSENRTKVIDILRREYKDGSVEDGMRLASILLDSGLPAEGDEAVKILEDIADREDVDDDISAAAMDYLSLLYMGAVGGIAPQYDKALSFLIRGMVENGSVESTYILGDLFKDGVGPVRKDNQTAMALYRQAEKMALTSSGGYDHPLAMIYYRMACVANEKPDDKYSENEVLMYLAKAEAAVEEALLDGDDSSASVRRAIDEMRAHVRRRHAKNAALA